MTNTSDTFKTIQAQSAERRLDGIYKQRGKNDFVMLRVRGPAACWTADGLGAVSKLAKEIGDGQLHFTTRGDVELHGVPFADVDRAISRLEQSGLSTRGACGDSIRNVEACPGGGVCPNELVDTLELARQVSRELTAVPAYEKLPRKFKISISGCQRACALPQIQDVGIAARRLDGDNAGRIGFDVYLAGGLGRHPKLGWKIPEVIQPSGLIPFIRAAIECFNELGDRERRHRARMKFLAESLGREGLLARIKERLADQAWHYVI